MAKFFTADLIQISTTFVNLFWPEAMVSSFLRITTAIFRLPIIALFLFWRVFVQYTLISGLWKMWMEKVRRLVTSRFSVEFTCNSMHASTDQAPFCVLLATLLHVSFYCPLSLSLLFIRFMSAGASPNRHLRTRSALLLFFSSFGRFVVDDRNRSRCPYPNAVIRSMCCFCCCPLCA